MHKVKCFYCYEQFDRDIEPYVMVGRRYAHKRCAEKTTFSITDVREEDRDKFLRSQIIDIIFRTLKMQNIELKNNDYALFQTQIDNLVNQGCTLAGIYLTLRYCYEIKHKPIDKLKTKGISSVLYWYDEAKVFFDKIQSAIDYNETVTLTHQSKTVNVHFDEEKTDIRLINF